MCTNTFLLKGVVDSLPHTHANIPMHAVTIPVSYSTVVELILTTRGVITSVRHLCCISNVLKCEKLKPLTQLTFFYNVEMLKSVETGAECCLNINMSIEIRLAEVRKQTHLYTICIRRVWVYTCVYEENEPFSSVYLTSASVSSVMLPLSYAYVFLCPM